MIPLSYRTMSILNIVVILVIILNSSHSASIEDGKDLFTINVTMKNYETTREDQYGFVRYQLPDEEMTIVGYNPLVHMAAAHHMLTYACEQPGSGQPFWTDGGACGGGQQMIIHGWARNAPALNLPDGVGFAVGKNTPYKYIVVNLHYLSILKNDQSGNQLIMSRKPRKYHAGVVLSGTNSIYLRPKTHTIKTPFSCQYNGPKISIFAARVHAHQWARVNSLYRVRDGKITQIVKGDPQWPQSFYPLPSPVEILSGDYLVGQCVYDNDEDRSIQVGSTHNDEMCNVYGMYSYEANDGTHNIVTAPFQNCWSNQFSQIAALIPPDSEVPPKKPADIGGTADGHQHHAEHAMTMPTGTVYTNVENWPEAKSLPQPLGEIGGIALNNDNSELIVFHRGSRKWESKYFTDSYRFINEVYGPIEENVLAHIDTRTGQTKSRWGAKMFYLPHGLTIDHEGNYWVTDIALHQVLMFKSNDLTHPALTVGKMFEYGSGPNHFCRPADVAVMKNGDFFVADGYCNSRIVKFNRKGEYITEWGSETSGNVDADGFPLPNAWNIVHSIALNEDAQLICGADRENDRIQCFNSTTGEFLRQIHVELKEKMGPIFAIEFAPNANGTILFAVTGGFQLATKKVYMINAQTGDILTSFDSSPSLISPHDITVSNNAREIYVGELATTAANSLHKFELTTKKELPSETFSKRIDFRDKNFRISLMIMAAFAIPVLVAVIVGCLVRMKNIRDLNRMNTYVDEGKRSVLGNWLNRRDGFKRLEQFSDGENEPLDNDSQENSDNETITIPANSSITAATTTKTTNINF